MGVTGATVVAGEDVAGAGAHGAVLTGEAECARAGEVVYTVDAGAGVATGVAGAVVNVGLAARAGEAWPTAARDVFTVVQTLSACRETERFQLLTHDWWRETGCEDRMRRTAAVSKTSNHITEDGGFMFYTSNHK